MSFYFLISFRVYLLSRYFLPIFSLAYPYVLLGFLDGEFDIPPQGFSLLFWLPTLPLANITKGHSLDHMEFVQ